MSALDLAAVGALAAVGDQPGDAGADRRDLFDELLDRLDPFDRAAAVRTGRQRHLDLLIDVRGHGAMDTGMPLGATGPFPLGFGDFLGVAASEGRGLSSGLALGLVELVAQGAVLGDEVGDPLLQLGDDSAQGLMLLTKLFDQGQRVCEGQLVCQGLHVRGHDPPLGLDMTIRVTARVGGVNHLPR